MIRRDAGKHVLVIEQHDHALLAGRLAARVGNGSFAPPGPFGPVVAAVAQHDAGWTDYDVRPTLNREGLPRHTFEMPISTVLQLWSESTRRAASAGPYAQLLVSLHGLALSNFILAKPATEPASRTPHETFEINRFQHREVELQEALRRSLGLRTDLPLKFGLAEPGRSPEEDLLLGNFRLLEAMDSLSLVLCFDRLLFDRTIGLFGRAGEREDRPLELRRADDGLLLVYPWPFEDEEIEETVPTRRIAPGPYASDDDYRAALAAAPLEGVRVRLRGDVAPGAAGQTR